MIRRSSSINTKRIDHIFSNPSLKLVYGDLTDSTNITHILANIKTSHPDMTILEVYNLGAQSHVQVSFELPEYTTQVDAIGTLRLLEAIRSNQLESVTRFYQASTSELFGMSKGHSFNEETEMYPRSPYACSKLYAYWIVKNYREAYNMFSCSGVLFNHETIAGNTPMIFKLGSESKEIDIKPISEIVRYHTIPNNILVDESIEIYQEGEVQTDLYVWDNSDWTKVKFASGYKHDIENNPKDPKIIISKNSCYMATNTHNIIMEDGSEKEIQNIEINDHVKSNIKKRGSSITINTDTSSNNNSISDNSNNSNNISNNSNNISNNNISNNNISNNNISNNSNKLSEKSTSNSSTNISKLRSNQKDKSLDSTNNASTFSKRKYKRNEISINTAF
jgi:hypothetical protein